MIPHMRSPTNCFLRFIALGLIPNLEVVRRPNVPRMETKRGGGRVRGEEKRIFQSITL
jgi:hypothetical protein